MIICKKNINRIILILYKWKKPILILILSNRDTLLQLITIYKNKGKVQIVELLKDLENLSTQNELLNDTVEYYSQIINTFKNIKTKELKNLIIYYSS